MEIQPLDNYLLTLDSKYTEEIILSSGLKLFLDPSYRPEWNSTVIGTVSAIPKNSNENIKINDTVLFSYTVVGQREYASTGSIFHSIFTEENPHFQKYRNGKGEFLNINSMPGVIGLIWVGVNLSSRGELISGAQGSESEVNRWKSQFTFDGGGGYKYKNLLPCGNKEYWICKPTDIFAKIVDGNLVAVGDRAILEPIDIPIPKDIQTEMGIKIPDSSVRARLYDRAILLSGGGEGWLKNGQILGFQEKYLEKYEYNSKQYFLIKKKRLLGEYQKI